MGIPLFILILIAAAILIIVLSGIRIVQQSTVKIVERLGKYHRTLESGINVIIPFLDKIKLINTRRTKYDLQGRAYIVEVLDNYVDLRERVFDFPKQNVITKDNVTLEIDALLYFQITDPFKAVYEVENLPIAIEKLTQTTLRNVIGELELDQTLSSRDTINAKLRTILDDATDKWGVKVNRVELKDISPPKEIREAMEKQMRAEREKRQAILLAEGDKQAKILQAEGEREKLIREAEGARQSAILKANGEAEAKIKIAEAEANAIKLIKNALTESNVDPTQYLVAIKYIEALREIATQQGEKTIFLPYEISGVLSSLGSIKEIFNKK
ncbi:MAG TPA: SPFH domain-containing protein [Spirochaetota bacterium]|nr:SPFH domain-containing protein [Spirochaetota bacterium]HOL56203.1 SPFH domain-containing protein [Spirochaetota bacterium]HPP03820.1 SPFH domain-containing protein [Spirochaetota bacterium]